MLNLAEYMASIYLSDWPICWLYGKIIELVHGVNKNQQT